jgi:hypothetical protein
VSRRVVFWLTGLAAVALCAIPFATVGMVAGQGRWAWRWNLRAERTVAQTVRAMQVVRERDAARAVPYRDGVTTVIRPGFVDSVRQRVERQVPDGVAKSRLGGPGVPVVVWVIPDTALVVTRGGAQGTRTSLGPVAVTPEWFDGRRCLVIYVFNRWTRGPAMNPPFERSGPAAICGFYAQYGFPGPGTQAWLDATRYDYASSGSTEPPPPRELAARFRRERSAMHALSALEYAPDGGVLTVRCTARGDASCDALALRPRNDQLADLLPAGFVSRRSDSDLYLPTRVPRSLLARIEQALGAERFAQLWSAQEPFPQAFERIAGRSLGSFVADQMRLPEEAAARWHQPWIPLPTALGAIAVIGAALGLAMGTAPRRVDG